jgi:hypothetical protein
MAARERKSPLVNLIAGGSAGFMEALICHPLDTIKVRMQLAKNVARNASVSSLCYALWFFFCLSHFFGTFFSTAQFVLSEPGFS